MCKEQKMFGEYFMAKYSKKRAFSPVALIILILGVALLAVCLWLRRRPVDPGIREERV